jgi:hypothetical protein
MSWFPEKKTGQSWVHRVCQRILKTGPIPKHVAFIMDGNRRFAVKNHMERAEGHFRGFDKLSEVSLYDRSYVQQRSEVSYYVIDLTTRVRGQLLHIDRYVYSPIKGTQGAYIHVNKQLILTIKINNIHADELNTIRVHALRTAHIYKQFTCRQDFDLNKRLKYKLPYASKDSDNVT